MIALLSPAKRLDWTSPTPRRPASAPRFPAETARLADAARGLEAADLKRLMGVSDAIAALNVERFRSFGEVPPRAAIDAFAGDVYMGFAARTLDATAMRFAQKHVRILSGLYGLLRPFDRIQPYRLEMGTRWAAGADDLYSYWGARIADAVVEDLNGQRGQAVINLASEEYWGAVDVARLPGRVVKIDFRDRKAGELRMNSFAAKRARGMMARHMCEVRAATPEALRGFTAAGYAFVPDLSDRTRYLFARDA